MRTFKMNEISAVDRPAQAGATALIMKRDDSSPKKVKKEAPMADDDKDRIDALEKQLATATAVAKFSDATRTHYNSLDEDEQEAFLAKSDEDRQAEVDEAIAKADEEAKKTAKSDDDDDDENPVVHKTAGGLEIRKSDGDVAVALAKQNDDLVGKVDELVAKNDDMRIQKRAEDEFKFLPGDVKTRVSIIKSVEAIADKKERAAAEAALKAQNEAMEKAFKTYGTDTGNSADADDTPEAQLDKLAKSYAAENKVDEAEAYNKVLETPAGRELYAQTYTQ